MFIKGLKKVSNDYIGAISGCMPFLCKLANEQSLKKALAGELDNYLWESISIKEAECVNPAILMYVKHIHVDNNPRSMYSINNIKQLKNILNIDGNMILNASINGIMVDTVLFLKDKYKTEDNGFSDLETNDKFYLSRLGSEITGCTVRGTFDLRTCCYFNC